MKKKVLWATYYNVTYDSWTGDPEDATAKGWEVRARSTRGPLVELLSPALISRLGQGMETVLMED